jgi:hypothetical protein
LAETEAQSKACRVIQLTSKWFCAAVVLDKATDRVMRCAPILNYMMGWPRARVLRYARLRKWEATEDHGYRR